jgi:DNA repair protein RecO (recombination protein O)
MQRKSKAFILHAKKYGENGRILHLYTQEEGMLSLFVRSVGSAKKGGIGAYLEPMTRVEVCYDKRNTHSLAVLKELNPISPEEIIRSSLIIGSISMFMAEVVHASLNEEEQDEQVFNLLWNWMDTLNTTNRYADIPVRFLISMSDVLGFSPDRYSEGDIFDLRDGVFISLPEHKDHLDAGTSKLLKRFLHETSPSLTSVTRNDRESLLDGLLSYYKNHIPNFKEVRSHSILNQVLS